MTASATTSVGRQATGGPRALPLPRTVGPASRTWSVLLAVAAGPVTDAAFPGRSWWPTAFVGTALLVLALRRDSARWGFVVGLLYGLGFFLPHVWANEAVGQPIGWLALALFQALYLGVFGAGWVWVRRGAWVRESEWRQVVSVTVLWVAVEQVRGRWPFGGFPWGSPAFSQTDSPLLRLASVGGEPLVSGAVVAVGAVLALVVLRLWRRRAGEAGLAPGRRRRCPAPTGAPTAEHGCGVRHAPRRSGTGQRAVPRG